MGDGHTGMEASPDGPPSYQRSEIFNAEAATDFLRKAGIHPVDSFQNRPNECSDICRQRRERPLVGQRKGPIPKAPTGGGIHPFSLNFGEAWPPTEAKQEPWRLTGDERSGETAVERVEQYRQIRLAGIARPDEHRERAQIHGRTRDRPEVRYLEPVAAGCLFDVCHLSPGNSDINKLRVEGITRGSNSATP